MIDENTFDWSITDRPIAVLLPSIGRREQLIPGVKRIAQTTGLSTDQWIIVVLNTNIHEDLSDLAEFNCVYLTLQKSLGQGYRNAGFVRNYMIKRCRSQRIIFRDAEIFSQGDWLTPAAQLPADAIGELWTYGRAYYNEVVGGMSMTASQAVTREIQANPMADLLSIILSHRMIPYRGMTGYGWTAPTRLLQDIHGYDERLYNHGWGHEDSDMHDRLRESGQPILQLSKEANVWSTHLYHPPGPFPDGVNHQRYQEVNPKELVRNPTGQWGEW